MMTEKQAAYHRQRSRCRVASLLTSHFSSAQLLTLRYASGHTIPPPIADSQYYSLMHRVRYLVGEPFPYVKLVEYSQTTAQVTAYRLITDLPADVCQKIADGWFMGEATVESLDAQQLAALAAEISKRPDSGRGKNRRLWTTSRYLAQRRK